MSEGFSDLLKMGDELNIDVENEDIIELELSKDNEYISFIYNKNTKEYTIEYIDMNELEEYEIPLDDDFNGFEVEGINISREDFTRFKELVESELND